MSPRQPDPEMLVLVDVGNTNTIFGVYRGDELLQSFRLSTDSERTADEYGALLLPLFERAGLDPTAAGAVVVSSVVPPLHPTLERLSARYFAQTPLFIEPGIKTGMVIRYDNPAEVGADRIVNSVAAREIYGAPAVVVDFGTATTFDVVTPKGEYLGGAISPGVTIAADALYAHAAKLPRVEIARRAARGVNVLGICNGFQILLEAGLLQPPPDHLHRQAAAVDQRRQQLPVAAVAGDEHAGAVGHQGLHGALDVAQLDMLFLARHDGAQPIALTSAIGKRLPASSTASYAALGEDFDHALGRLLRRSARRVSRDATLESVPEQGVNP